MAEKTTNQPNSVIRYFREVRGELRKVTWPTRDESRRLTAVVTGVTLAFAIFFFLLDLAFAEMTEMLIKFIAGI